MSWGAPDRDLPSAGGRVGGGQGGRAWPAQPRGQAGLVTQPAKVDAMYHDVKVVNE